ncbi:MAG: efflux RND transporter periplasmic adaptor subunit [Alphaproteobacteria bacterium]
MRHQCRAAISGLGLLLISGLTACGDKPQAAAVQAEQAIPVRVAKVLPAPDADDVTAYGIVRPGTEARLSFKIGGMIRTLNVDQGDRITRGQILAELDTSEIDSHASRAALAVEKARRDVDRMAPLAAKGFASTQRMDDSRTALDAALAEQRAIEFDRSLAHIIAPADGIVLARHADVREMAGVGAPIVTVSTGSGSYVLKAGLSDRDVARIKIGDAAIIRLDAFDGIELPGRVLRMAAESDPRSGTFETEIAFIEPDRPLTSGFMGEVSIRANIAGPYAGALAIPASAILEGHGAQASVFVVDPKTSKARRQRISVGKLDGSQIIVTKGLAPEDAVVTAGAAYLRDGVSVSVTAEVATTP